MNQKIEQAEFEQTELKDYFGRFFDILKKYEGKDIYKKSKPFLKKILTIITERGHIPDKVSLTIKLFSCQSMFD